MNKEYINEAAWSKVLIFLKSLERIYIKNEANCKRFIESIYWISRTGAQWREMHEYYGKWNSIYRRFNEWAKKNIWHELLEYCVQDPDLENIMIDATIVRAHACAAGYGRQEDEGLGRSKGGFSTKIHAKVDALGNPLKIIITAGQRSEITQAENLLMGNRQSNVLADKGYDCDRLRAQIKSQNCTPVIPTKSNRIIIIPYDKDLYKERHAIECFFSKIKYFRRVFSRYDKSGRNFGAFLSFVGAMIWLR